MDINTRKLRIKAKHLAEEARIIRREARLVRGLERHELNHHRTTVVRNEARATQLAYQFLLGKRAYREIERTCDSHKFACVVQGRVEDMVKRYGGTSRLPDLAAWLAA